MDEYKKQLKDYITLQKSHGQPVESIRLALIQHGWEGDMVDAAITELGLSRQEAISLPAPVVSVQQPAYQNPDLQSSSTPSKQVQTTERYRVVSAVRESVSAIKHNTSVFIAAASLSFGLVLASTLGLHYFFTEFMLSRLLLANLSLAVTIVGALVLVLLAYALTMAATTILLLALALTVQAGAENHQTSLVAIYKDLLSRTTSTMITTVMVGMIAVGPLLIISTIVSVINFTSGAAGANAGGQSIIVNILSFLAISWLIFALFRYILAPLAAIFESRSSPLHYLQRSNHLLKGEGRRFVFKGCLLLLVFVIIAASVAGENINQPDNTQNPVLTGLILMIEMIATCMLVMLYHNRKLVKDGPAQQ